MKKQIAKLIDLKSILSLLFCITTCFLAIKDKIEMETFMAITMAIITYYFTRKSKEDEEIKEEIAKVEIPNEVEVKEVN